MKLRDGIAQAAKFTRRLSVRLSLLVSLLLSLTILAYGWRTASQQTTHMDRAVRTHAAVLADSIAETSTSLLVVQDLAALEEQLLRYNALPGVLAIRISDRSGRVLSQTHVDENGAPVPVYMREPSGIPPVSATQLRLNAGGDLLVQAPIVSGEPIGDVEITHSLAEVRAIRPQILLETSLAALAAIAVNLTLLLLYLRRPLRAVRLAATFSEQLNTRRGDEIAVNAEAEEIEQLQLALNFASHQLWDEQRALEESRERLEAVLAYTADGILTFDDEGRFESFNPAAERIFGPWNGQRADDLMPGWRRQDINARHEIRAHRTDGTAFPADVTVSEMWVGNRRLYAATVRDLSDTKKLERLSSRLGRVLEHAANEIYIFDAASLRFVQASDGALANLGYTLDELTGLTPLDLLPGMTRAQFDALAQPLRDDSPGNVTFEGIHRRRNGTFYPIEVRLLLSRTESPPVFVAIVQDTTVRKSAEARLAYLSNYDTLTELPNRQLFSQRLERTLEEAENNDRLVAVLFVDLDRFKMINDTLGHEAGDELLKVVARRLSETLRPGDTLARTGGDEFVVALANVAHVDDVARTANRILGRLSPAITIGGRELFVTPSIGITLYPFDDRRGEELLRNADTAMFQAKERGGNTFCFYTAELNARAERQLTLETGLRHALERSEFHLLYQPQVDVRTGVLVGAEALLRWQHPEWDIILPAEFIPLAEETGLILPIGEWVLEQACTQAEAWHEAGYGGLRVAVNLSGRQLPEKTLIESIENLFGRFPQSRGMLELEITESILMQDLEETAAILDGLASLGIRVSMDDFGTGYSSLSYLKRLPIDALKIDQSFVRDITEDADNSAIVQAIIAMAHHLDIHVLAEGVETAEQLAFLQRHGCDTMQGYFVSRPLTAAQFSEFLVHRKPGRASA